MKTEQIGIFTRIYRNEPEIKLAIQSVLIQTYTNFKFYILVNDRTYSEVAKFAMKDKRIRIIKQKEKNDGFRTYAKTIAADGNDYVCTIDADDYWAPTYLEKMLTFIKKYELDMVSCGVEFINNRHQKLGERRIGNLICNSKQEISDNFKRIYAFMRPIWGKLYVARVILEYDDSRLPNPEAYGGYGGDTLFVLNLMYEVNSLGIMDENLYFYLISPNSGSYTISEGRLDSDAIVYEFAKQYIEDNGALNKDTSIFLLQVYAEALKDTLRLLCCSKLSDEDKISKMMRVYQHPLTKELFYGELMTGYHYNLYYQELIYVNCYENVSWMLEKELSAELFLCVFPEVRNKLKKEEIIVLLSKKSYMDIFTHKGNDELCLELLADIDKLNPDVVAEIIQKLADNVFLKNIDCDNEFLIIYPQLIYWVLERKYREALRECMNIFCEYEVVYQAKPLATLWVNLANYLNAREEYQIGIQVLEELKQQ